METKFKVIMKKDEEVLQDFILFTYRVNNPGGMTKLVVFSLGIAVIGVLAVKGGSPIAGGIISVVGVIMLAFSLFMHKIAVGKLKKADVAYKNQTELTYAFANSGIYVYENGELERNVGGYSHVSCLYENEKNFYVGVNNEDLYLLPKKCFVEGNVEEFVEFIQAKGNEKCEFLPTTLKNRWMMFRVKMKQADAEHDAKAAELRRMAKEKKRKKK